MTNIDVLTNIIYLCPNIELAVNVYIKIT